MPEHNREIWQKNMFHHHHYSMIVNRKYLFALNCLFGYSIPFAFHLRTIVHRTLNKGTPRIKETGSFETHISLVRVIIK